MRRTWSWKSVRSSTQNMHIWGNESKAQGKNLCFIAAINGFRIVTGNHYFLRFPQHVTSNIFFSLLIFIYLQVKLKNPGVSLRKEYLFHNYICWVPQMGKQKAGKALGPAPSCFSMCPTLILSEGDAHKVCVCLYFLTFLLWLSAAQSQK